MHRQYQTETSAYLAKLHKKQDYRSEAPPPDVKVYKQDAQGNLILDRIEPPLTYDQELQNHNRLFSRGNKINNAKREQQNI